jgi:anti-anti-sigma regulatory factor
VALHKRLQGAGGRLTLAGVRPAVQDILRVTQLDQVLDLKAAG